MRSLTDVSGTSNCNMFFRSKHCRTGSLGYWGTFKPCPACGRNLFTNGKAFMCIHCEGVERQSI